MDSTQGINNSVPLWRILDFPIAAVWPIGCMADDPSANHVQIDVNKTTVQMLVSFDRSGMIPVLPECAVTRFPLIVFLTGATGN
jgi:hypothetical protein